MAWKQWLENLRKRERETKDERKDELWVWIRVPLSALERAIGALKERVSQSHYFDKREEANRDNVAAEDIKQSLRENHNDESEF